jgi:hypothetical protein
VTGFVVDQVEEMAEAIWRVADLNPHACRVHVETNHSSARMASQYERLYETVLSLEAERNWLAA